MRKRGISRQQTVQTGPAGRRPGSLPAAARRFPAGVQSIRASVSFLQRGALTPRRVSRRIGSLGIDADNAIAFLVCEDFDHVP
jgi:hypothetical protein